MANRVAPTPFDADNSAGRCAGNDARAVCSDWRSVRRFHVGTGRIEPTQDAGYTTAGSPFLSELSVSLLFLGGSPYTPG